MLSETALERAIEAEALALKCKALGDERNYLAFKRMEARWLAKAEKLQNGTPNRCDPNTWRK